MATQPLTSLYRLAVMLTGDHTGKAAGELLHRAAIAIPPGDPDTSSPPAGQPTLRQAGARAAEAAGTAANGQAGAALLGQLRDLADTAASKAPDPSTFATAPASTAGITWRRQSRRTILVAPALLALTVTLALAWDRGTGSSGHLGRPEAVDRNQDQANRGWILNADGEPPQGNKGMGLAAEAELDFASDPGAGTSGTPPLRELTPLPFSTGSIQTHQLSWTGDLPPEGQATLSVYSEAARGPILSSNRSPTRHRPSRGCRGRSTAPVQQRGAGKGELRQGSWVIHTPGRQRSFALPSQLQPAAGGRRVVTMQVDISAASAGSWQAVVTEARVIPSDEDPVPAVASVPGVPRDAGGYRVGAWEVPADGLPHPLQLPERLPPEVVFLSRSDETGDPDHPDRRPDPFSPVAGSFDALSTKDGTTAVRPGPPAALGGRYQEPFWESPDRRYSTTAGVPLTTLWATSTPATQNWPEPEQAETTYFLAYQPVSYSEFDFENAPPPEDLSARFDRSLASGDPEFLADSSDLDDDGRITLVLEGQVQGLIFTTEGKGRVHLSLQRLLLPQLIPWDGWWSSWTQEAATGYLPLQLFSSESLELELQVEGFDGGFSVSSLEQ